MTRLTIQLARTADGKQDYLQAMSGDMVSVNVVLIADRIILRDDRPEPAPPEEKP
jgi:hypothetical protein